MQFHVYIWSIAQRHNIYSCLDQVQHETQIFINLSRVFNQKSCIQNPHFLLDKLNKPIFHKNFDVFFFMYPYIHTKNMLLIDDMPYESVFNGPCSAIFLESFDSLCGEDHYVLGTILPWNFFISPNMVFPHQHNPCRNPTLRRV